MAHPDLDELFNSLLPTAQMLLKKFGEFLPFGAVMSPAGGIRHVAGKIEGDDYPGSEALIDLLTDEFEKEGTKGRLRAAGICYDVLTVRPGEDTKRDAICCGLEHYTGEALDVFVPYRKRVDGSIEYGDTFAAKRTATFLHHIPHAD